jgi:hypothetical protein
MKKIYLVWNLQMTECVGFDNKGDAHTASTGDYAFSDSYPFYSSLASAFRDIFDGEIWSSSYEEEPEDNVVLKITEIEVEESNAGL